MTIEPHIACAIDSNGRQVQIPPDVEAELIEAVKRQLDSECEHCAEAPAIPDGLATGGLLSDRKYSVSDLDAATAEFHVSDCDHTDRCCSTHNTNTIPHRGCILR